MAVLENFFVTSYRLFQRMGRVSKHAVLLLFRVFWGVILFYSGNENFQQFDELVAFLALHEFPAPEVFTSGFITIQITAGLFMIFGIFTQLTGLVLSVAMFFSLLTVHMHALEHVLTNPYEFIALNPVSYIIIGLTLFCFGGGAMSFDDIFYKWLKRNHK